MLMVGLEFLVFYLNKEVKHGLISSNISNLLFKLSWKILHTQKFSTYRKNKFADFVIVYIFQ